VCVSCPPLEKHNIAALGKPSCKPDKDLACVGERRSSTQQSHTASLDCRLGEHPAGQQWHPPERQNDRPSQDHLGPVRKRDIAQQRRFELYRFFARRVCEPIHIRSGRGSCGTANGGKVLGAPDLSARKVQRKLRNGVAGFAAAELSLDQRVREGAGCRPPGPSWRITAAAAQTRMVSVARIRLVSRKSTRLFKGIICIDISEFESYMPSHAVGSLPANMPGST